MIRKIILFLIVLLVLSFYPNPIQAEPFGFTVSGGVWTDNGFSTAGGGFLTGFLFPIDAGRGLYGRTQYHQFNIGDNSPVRSIDASFMLYYGLGKKYNVFFHVGAEGYMSGADGSQFVGGFGGDKTIWTIGREGYTKPNVFKIFGDVSFVDNEFEPTGQHFKAFIGLVFHPAQQ